MGALMILRPLARPLHARWAQAGQVTVLLVIVSLATVRPARAAVRFFVEPDGRLMEASTTRDLAFQQVLTLPFREFDFHEFTGGYILDAQPPSLTTGSVDIRPRLLDASGRDAADLALNGGRLIEVYPNLPTIPGILEGGLSGGGAVLNRTYTPAGGVVGAAVELSFTSPVQGFGVWIMDDILMPNRYVLKVTEAGGATVVSAPLESGNGTQLAVEGFAGVVSDVGITRVVVEQQTLSGMPTNGDFFYLDHMQVGGRLPPEICDNGADDNADGRIDCADPDCQNRPDRPDCGESICDDGADNDADSRADCADPDCFGKVGCTTEKFCSDRLDNDGDGVADCADSDCSYDVGCPEICNDGIDNNADGAVDCGDVACLSSPLCPSICDGIDPELLEFHCVDPGCSGLPACGPVPGPLSFFVEADGGLTSPPPDASRDLAFQRSLVMPFNELDFHEYDHTYIVQGSLPMSGPVQIGLRLLNAAGGIAVDPVASGGRLIETYQAAPAIPGIVEGPALLNRTYAPAGDVVGAAVEFSFSRPVEGFGVWVVEDGLEPNRFVLRVVQRDGIALTSLPLESGNGARQAIEGFLGASSSVGIIRATLEQQTLSGVASNTDLFYLDHVQVGSPVHCRDPFADFDSDGDVDQEDFGFFQTCITGPTGTVEAACFCTDHDGDNDVDSADLTWFRRCMSGPGALAEAGCDD